MIKTIRVHYNDKNGVDRWQYGKKADNIFGWQTNKLTDMLEKALGNRGKVIVSTEPKEGYKSVQMKGTSGWNKTKDYTVISPKPLKGVEFCGEGIARYFGNEVASQKKLKLYFKLTK